jgi:CelD/BcsL family acetyltransferase involved in cellulose biosynthesis
MAGDKLVCWSDLDELRDRADAWDDLWLRSPTTSSTCRAELMACWVERFAPGTEFCALAVERDGRMLAALPLVTRRVGRFLTAGGLPVNDWSQCGDLLLDESIESDESDESDDALRTLASGFSRLPWSVLWLDGVRLETKRWQRLQQMLQAGGSAVFAEPRFEIGWLELTTTRADIQKSWSKGFRKSLRRTACRLAERGRYELKTFTNIGDDEIEPLFMRATDVEQRSWKARERTSIRESDGIAEFYLRQCRLLAARRELVFAFLELDGRAIAFEIGWLAKSVYHSFKVGYDERFAAFGPGQLTMNLLIEQLLKGGSCKAIDCVGPMNDAMAHFRPATYAIGRMLIADRHLTGRALLSLYKHAIPHFRRWRESRSR